jgi:hypothetical protein
VRFVVNQQQLQKYNTPLVDNPIIMGYNGTMMNKELDMNCDLHTVRTATKLSPLMWANMVLDLEKIGLNGNVLLSASDEYLTELHEVYFPVPFDVE